MVPPTHRVVHIDPRADKLGDLDHVRRRRRGADLVQRVDGAGVRGCRGWEGGERMMVKKATPHPEREGREMYMWLLIARRRVVVGGRRQEEEV